jgi:hypothetical protein
MIIFDHSPFEFVIGSTDLIFIGRSIRMESVSGDGFREKREDRHMFSERPYLGFIEIPDRTQIDSSVSILREKTDPIILDLISRSDDEEFFRIPESIEHHHPET